MLQASRHSDDRRLICWAFTIAGLVHLGALFLPLPAAPPGPAAHGERVPTFEVRTWDIPVPPPTRRIVETRILERRPFLPIPEWVEPLPLDEPASERSRDPVIETAAPPGVEDLTYRPTPPEYPEPLEETADCLDLPVRLPGAVDPVYPRIPILVKASGLVVLRTVITADGEVAEVEVVSAPHPDLGFSESAVEAVSSWKYRPGRCHGQPVAVRMTVFVEFDLR